MPDLPVGCSGSRSSERRPRFRNTEVGAVRCSFYATGLGDLRPSCVESRERRMTAMILSNQSRNEPNAADDLMQRVARETVVRAHGPLAKRTTLRIGGPADLYVEPSSENDLATVLKFCAERALPFFVLGRGSNLLVRDAGFRGGGICLVSPFFSEVEEIALEFHCG